MRKLLWQNNEAEMKIVVGTTQRQSGYRGTEELVAWGATAIFVSNYNMSVGALECFNQKETDRWKRYRLWSL